MSSEADLLALFDTSGTCALTTIKRDGRPQISNVSYAFDAERRTFSISITDGRAKTKNLRRDPRAGLYTTSADRWSYVVAEGTATMTAVAADPHDAAVDALVELYRRISGQEHPDWDDYRRAMVTDGRLVLSVAVEHVYGLANG